MPPCSMNYCNRVLDSRHSGQMHHEKCPARVKSQYQLKGGITINDFPPQPAASLNRNAKLTQGGRSKINEGCIGDRRSRFQSVRRRRTLADQKSGFSIVGKVHSVDGFAQIPGFPDEVRIYISLRSVTTPLSTNHSSWRGVTSRPIAASRARA